MSDNSISLRGHHITLLIMYLLDKKSGRFNLEGEIEEYRNNGYNEELSRKKQEIFDSLDENRDIGFELVNVSDSLCEYCNRIDCPRTSSETDNFYAKAYGLEIGKRYTLDEILKTIQSCLGSNIGLNIRVIRKLGVYLCG